MISTIRKSPQPVDHADGRRLEAHRLIALALEMLDDEREQIVRDYLGHALEALQRLRDSLTNDR